MIPILLTSVVSYLLGSIPFGYLLVRLARGQDVRETGSGNIGATNVSRTSPALGVITLLLDALKGLSAVALTRFIFPGQGRLAALAALFAIIGHAFPVWLKFRGGKGVATSLGALILLAPKAMLLAVGIFAAVVLIFRYVSLASIVAVAVFPLLAWRLNSESISTQMLGLMIAAALLIIAKHHDNIHRLATGNESKWGRR